MTSIDVEYTLSDGNKVIVTETDTKLSASELFDEIVGYNSGMCYDIKDNKERTVVSIKLVD